MSEREEIQTIRTEMADAVAAGGGPEVIESLRQLFALTGGLGDYAFAAARLKELGAAGAKKSGLKPLRTYVARSVTVEPFLPLLAVHAALSGMWLELAIGGYGSFIDDLMNPDGALCRFQPDLVLFLSDLEDLAGGLTDLCATGSADEIQREAERVAGSVAGLLEALRRNSPARLVAQGLVLADQPVLGELADANAAAGESRAVARINEGLAAACRKIGDAVFFDQDHLAARHGRAGWRDQRMFRSSRVALAARFFRPYVEGLARGMRALYFAPRKVLCTDLDGTLWGGIVGEDGPEGVATGAVFPGNCFRSYQRYLKQLAARGVLLAIVSKNNPGDVIECFRMRAADLAVTMDDFAGVKIGWGDKCTSLQELARELSLGDSFVFVDDNPMECAAIRQQLPGVLVIQAPNDRPWLLAETVAAAGAFDTLSITADDRQRTHEYRAQAQRTELEAAASSREEFLKSLGIELQVLNALEAPLSRTAQLISKTNQFNLTTRRHSAGDVERFSRQPGNLAVAVRVRDRFGDAGVVGVALCQAAGHSCRIDTFLLSCRVIGRGIESALLAYVARHAKTLGATRLLGEYVPSAKNQLCEGFYLSHGMRRVEEGSPGEAILYELDLSQGLPEVPPWICVI
jgi:FkbH-like protein